VDRVGADCADERRERENRSGEENQKKSIFFLRFTFTTQARLADAPDEALTVVAQSWTIEVPLLQLMRHVVKVCGQGSVVIFTGIRSGSGSWTFMDMDS
jgi:hypothetical protein